MRALIFAAFLALFGLLHACDETYVASYIKLNEGSRSCSYDDTEGLRTVGIGFNMEQNGGKSTFENALPGVSFQAVFDGDRCLSSHEISQLFIAILPPYVAGARKSFPTMDEMTCDRRMVMIDFTFNLGSYGVSKWTNFRRQVANEEWDAAAANMRDSKYCRQVKSRCDRNTDILKTGKYAPNSGNGSSLNSNVEDKTDFTATVDRPNWVFSQGFTTLRQSLLHNTFGSPCSLSSSSCTDVGNDLLKKHIVTDNVGPFSVTGLKPALESLKKIFAAVEAESPELYSVLSVAQMQCCRRVASSNNFSVHSWGAAIDIKIDGVLDKYGDGKVQVGLIELYKYFNRFGWYWGAGFGTEDGMHFVVAQETFNAWIGAGKFSAPSSTSCYINGIEGQCGHVSGCTGYTISGKCPGAWDIQCCVHAKAKCNAGGDDGFCVNYEKCTGTTTRGLCPGPWSIQCCTGDGRREETETIFKTAEEQIMFEATMDQEEGQENEDEQESSSSNSALYLIMGSVAVIGVAGTAVFFVKKNKKPSRSVPLDYNHSL